jgi:hypothetical protein
MLIVDDDIDEDMDMKIIVVVGRAIWATLECCWRLGLAAIH